MRHRRGTTTSPHTISTTSAKTYLMQKHDFNSGLHSLLDQKPHLEPSFGWRFEHNPNPNPITHWPSAAARSRPNLNPRHGFGSGSDLRRPPPRTHPTEQPKAPASQPIATTTWAVTTSRLRCRGVRPSPPACRGPFPSPLLSSSADIETSQRRPARRCAMRSCPWRTATAAPTS